MDVVSDYTDEQGYCGQGCAYNTSAKVVPRREKRITVVQGREN